MGDARPRRCPRCGHDHDFWALDLCSGAGGAAEGYHRAGFGVVGVDNRPQPRYPFEFIQADAMTFPLDGYDAYHASTPCQDHMRSRMRQQNAHGTGWMLAATRERFQATGRPWVLENVPGAPMRADYKLCGCMFGLTVERERWFELWQPAFELRSPCYHAEPVVNPMRTKHGPWYREHGRIPTRDEVAAAMGIDWMRGEEIKQAIPPAYTEYIGQQLIEHLTGERAA
jgi:DNA (cytosine-5)-methyltransferase 1